MSSTTTHGEETSWVHLLHSLVNETVRVEVSSTESTKVGLLVDVDPSFITLVSASTTGTGGSGGGGPAVRRIYIPNNKILAVTPS
jgi:hypothetical protein